MNPVQGRDEQPDEDRDSAQGKPPVGRPWLRRPAGGDDPLTRLLRAYSESTAPSQAKLEELAERITAAIQEEKFLDLEPSPTVLLAPRWKRARRGWSVAVAAALLVGVGVGTWFGSRRFTPPDRAPDIAQAPRSTAPSALVVAAPPPPPNFDRQRLGQAARRLFVETERLFPGQLLWIAESSSATGTGGNVELGIAREERSKQSRVEAANQVATGPLVTIHLVARARSADNQPWRDAWEVTVISRPEETVSFRPSNDSLPGGEWALWAMTAPDGAIAVETRIEGTKRVESAQDSSISESTPESTSDWAAPLVDVTTVQQPGERLLVASMRRGEETIEVFQWVDVVHDPAGGEGPSPSSDVNSSREGA